MKNKLNIAEQLKQKYHKCEEVTNFKEMIERSAQIYKTRTAFKLKNKDGEKTIYDGSLTLNKKTNFRFYRYD